MEERRMKVFNLEAAKTGKPVCTRDGRMVRIICFDRKSLNNHFPMLALIDDGDGEEVLESYRENGKNGVSASDRDLFMLPEKHEGWVNILCNDDNGIYVAVAFYFHHITPPFVFYNFGATSTVTAYTTTT